MWTVFHTESSLGWGGQEIRILNESIGIRGKGHRVIIVAESESTLREKAIEHDFETIPLSFRNTDYPATFFKMLHLIKDYKPDFINTHSSKDSWITGIASRSSRYKPYIIRTRHLSTPVSSNPLNSQIYRTIPHKIITTGESIRSLLINEIHVMPGKVISIPTGVDQNFFNPEDGYNDIRYQLSLNKNTPLVGMVSVLRSWKGHDYFIEAANLIRKRNPDLRFLIVGDGPRKKAIKKLIKEKDLHGIMFLTGHREDIPDIMNSLDILVHPSYANEGIPQSVLQAMAMGTPVIASNLNALTEVIHDNETGLVVPIKDPKELCDKILMLLKSSELLSKLGRNARMLVTQTYSLERMIDSTIRLYSSLCYS